MESLPASVRSVMENLGRAGFQAFLIGGSVRDTLLGRTPTDYDVATDAVPQQVAEIFADTAPTGIRYGTVTVRGEPDVEVTTFRSDGEYVDGRRPDSVHFSKSLREDVARRDFTINALAMTGAGKVIDLVDGMRDIEGRVIRCVGDPVARFREDALRMMRAVRLECQISGAIENATRDAIRATSSFITNVSWERIRDELVKILLTDKAGAGIRSLKECGLLVHIIPELEACAEVNQKNKHHDRCVFDHIIDTIDATPPRRNVRLAALLHDVGKPSTFKLEDGGLTSFIGHHIRGGEIARDVLTRLRFDHHTIDTVCLLISEHMSAVPYLRAAPIQRFINAVGVRNLPDLFDLLEADLKATKPPHDYSRLNSLKEEIQKALERGDPLAVKDLAIDGTTLLEWGVAPGKEVGQMLEAMLERVYLHPGLNTVSGLRQVFLELWPPKDVASPTKK